MGKKGKHKTPAVNLDEQICNANMDIEDAFDAESFAIADEDILMMPDDSNELLPLLELLDIDTVELDRIEAEQRLEAENEADEKKQRNENGTPIMKPIDQQDNNKEEVKHFYQSNEIDTVEPLNAGNVESFLAPTCLISHEPREIDANKADAVVTQIFASECVEKVMSAVELDAEVAAADEWVTEALAAENLVLDVSTTQLHSLKIDNLNSVSLVTSTTEEPKIETPEPNDTQNIYRYQDISSKPTKLLELSSLKVTEFNSSKLSSIEKVVSEHDTMSSDISLAHMYSSDAFECVDDVLRKPACALKSIQLMKSAMKADTSVGKSYTFKSVSKRDSTFQIPKFDPLFTTHRPKAAAEIKKNDDTKEIVELKTSDGESFFKPTMSLYTPHNLIQSAVWPPTNHEAAPLDSLNLLEINKSNTEQTTEKVKNVEKSVALNKTNTKQMVEISDRRKCDVNKWNIFSGSFNSTKGKTLNDSVNSNMKSVPSNYKTIIASNLSSIQHFTTNTSEPKQINNVSIENVTDSPKDNDIILPNNKNGNNSSKSSSTPFAQKEDELKKHSVVKSVPEYSVVKNIIDEQRKLTTTEKKIKSIEADTRILKGIHLIHVEKSVGKFSVIEKSNSNSALLTPRINGKTLPQMNSNYNSKQTVGFSEEINNLIKQTSTDQRNNEQISKISCSKLKSSSKEAAMKNLDLISKAAKPEKTKSVFIEEDSENKSCTIKQDKRVASSYLPMSIKNNTETKNQNIIETGLPNSYTKVIKPVTTDLDLDMNRSKSTFISEPRDKAKIMTNVNLTSIQLEFSETKGIDIGMKMATNTIPKEHDNVEPSVTALFYRNPKTAVLIKPELITFEKSLERNKNTDTQNNVTNYFPIEDFKVMQNISSLSPVISKKTYDDKTTYSVMNEDLIEGMCIAEKKDIKLVQLENDNINKRIETSLNKELSNETKKTIITDFKFLMSDSDSALTTNKKVNKSIEMNQTHAVDSITSPHFQPTIQDQAAIPMLKSIQMSERTLQVKKLLPKENKVKKTVTMNMDNNVKAVNVFNIPASQKEVAKKTGKLIKTRATSSEKKVIRSNLKANLTSTEDFKLLQSFSSSCVPQNVASMTKCDAYRKKSKPVDKKSVPLNHNERFKDVQSSTKPLSPGKITTYKRLKMTKNDNSRTSNDAKQCTTISRTAPTKIAFVPQKGSSMKKWNKKPNANKEIFNDKKNLKEIKKMAKLTPTKQNDTTETAQPPVITFVPQKGAHLKEWSLQLQKNNTSSKENSDVKAVTEKLRLEKSNLSQNIYSSLLRVVSEKDDTMNKCNLLKRDSTSVATKHENLNNSTTLTANVNENKCFLDPESNKTLKKHVLVKPSFLPLLTPNGYRCLCNRQFENRTNLRTHVIEIHEKTDKRIRSFECNLCTKRYFSKKNLKSHFLVIHKNLKKFICNSCGKKFETKTKLRLHINCKHAKLRECKCTICFKTFLTEKHVIRHVNSVHYIIKAFSCPTCANVFDSSTHLRSHIKIVHEKLRNFHCDQCEAKFSTNSNLRRHVRIVHENIRGHACKVCQKEFISTSHLNRHFNIMHKHFRLYKCNECGLSKSTKSNLQNHVRSHSKQNKSK